MVALNRVHVAAVAGVLLLSFLPATQGDNSYCKICRDHTLCIYQGYAATCHKVLLSGVNKADAKIIVETHNGLRNIVASGAEGRGRPGPQPAAADMNALVWDNELAKIAQRWADQCTFQHDSCRKVKRFDVGQNMYMSSRTGAAGRAEWQPAIKAWYDEVKDFSKNNVDKYQFSVKTGHYSQVVWGDTRYVGCGFTAYTESNGWKTQMYVCNYGTAGNVMGRSVYARGKSCSKCRRGCLGTYSSLCA